MPLFIAALVWLCGCSKERHTGTTEVTYLKGISFYGSLFTNCTVCYSAVGAGAERYSWRSSDGVTSTDELFCRKYATEQNDTVRLTINNNPDFSAMQIVRIRWVKEGVTAKLAGNKTWRVFEGEGMPDGSNVLNYTGTTNFAIEYLDPATLLIGNDTLRLYSYYDTTSTYNNYYKSITNEHDLSTTWVLHVYKQPHGDSLIYGLYEGISSGRSKQKLHHCP